MCMNQRRRTERKFQPGSIFFIGHKGMKCFSFVTRTPSKNDSRNARTLKVNLKRLI